MGTELLLLRRRALMMADSMVLPTLLYIDQAEISMCCKDGTDGKDGSYQLTSIFSDGLTRSATWTTSDASKATVNSSGLVTFSAATTFGDVTISCSYRGVTKSCLLTVYATMPTHTRWDSGLAVLKGGKGLSQIGVQSTMANFTSSNLIGISVKSSRIISKYIVPSNHIVGCSAFDASFYSSNEVVPFQSASSKASLRKYTSLLNFSDYTFGPSLTIGALYAQDVFSNSLSAVVNGTSYTPVIFGSASLSSHGTGIVMRTTNNHAKIILYSFSGSERNAPDMSNRLMTEGYYIAQNYIRYTDRTVGGTSRVNYTVIPNIGTLGSSFDLSCNNVPSAWFGV